MAVQGLLYQRLADELSGMIASRILRPGDRLPSVRKLAHEKRLSVSTVVQALRQLEDDGQIEARPQSGFFVRLPVPERLSPLEPPPRRRVSRPVTVDISSRLVGIRSLNFQPDMVPLGGRNDFPTTLLRELAWPNSRGLGAPDTVPRAVPGGGRRLLTVGRLEEVPVRHRAAQRAKGKGQRTKGI